MRAFALAVVGVVLAGMAAAQQAEGGLGGYSSMRIDRVGRFRGSFDDAMTIREMTNGVSITLLSEDPNQPPLPIRANTMKFEWEEGSDTPARIEMEGNVDVEHPKGKLTAEKGVWDFKKGILEFTGNPVLDSPRAKGVRGSKIAINFNENDLFIENMQADLVGMRGGAAGEDGGGGGAVLTEGDVKDWPGFINTLKAQAKADAPSPGKRILSQFDKDDQSKFLGAPTDAIVKQKAAVLKQLNRVFAKPGLYTEEAWKGTALSEDAKKLLGAKEVSPEDQLKLNRLLVEAAFPDYIAKR